MKQTGLAKYLHTCSLSLRMARSHPSQSADAWSRISTKSGATMGNKNKNINASRQGIGEANNFTRSTDDI